MNFTVNPPGTPHDLVRDKGCQRNNWVGIKGVSFRKTSGKYLARIQKDKVGYRLGVFDTPQQAEAAYAEAAKKLHGEYHRLN